MEWGNIIGGLAAVLMLAIGVPLALRQRKKGGPQNVGELLQYLHEMGVKSSLMERGGKEEKVGVFITFDNEEANGLGVPLSLACGPSIVNVTLCHFFNSPVTAAPGACRSNDTMKAQSAKIRRPPRRISLRSIARIRVMFVLVPISALSSESRQRFE